jgi:hypothetical protein
MTRGTLGSKPQDAARVRHKCTNVSMGRPADSTTHYAPLFPRHRPSTFHVCGLCGASDNRQEAGCNFHVYHRDGPGTAAESALRVHDRQWRLVVTLENTDRELAPWPSIVCRVSAQRPELVGGALPGVPRHLVRPAPNSSRRPEHASPRGRLRRGRLYLDHVREWAQ